MFRRGRAASRSLRGKFSLEADVFFSCGALLVVTRVDFLFAKATQGAFQKTAKDGARKDGTIYRNKYIIEDKDM